jgi:hypothetical protein
MQSRWFVLALAVCAGPLSPALVAQERQQTTGGQVQLGVHKYRVQAGSVYEFEVVGEGFSPAVRLAGSPPVFLHPSYRRPFGAKSTNTYIGVFIPKENAERTLVVSPRYLSGVPQDGGTLKYTVTMKSMRLDERPLLKKEDKLTKDDPVHMDKGINRGTHAKTYNVRLKAQQICVIEMTPQTPNNKGGRLYTRVLVEDNGKLLAQDSGGTQAAVVLFRAPADGEYRVIATGLSQNSDLGDFTLTVRTAKGDQ